MVQDFFPYRSHRILVPWLGQIDKGKHESFHIFQISTGKQTVPQTTDTAQDNCHRALFKAISFVHEDGRL